jgi:hypothetical protein
MCVEYDALGGADGDRDVGNHRDIEGIEFADSIAVEENSLGKRLIGVLLDLECLWRADHGVCTGVEMW